MRRIITIVALIMLAIPLGVAAIRLTSQPPSAEFLGAALSDQAKASLDVNYVMLAPDGSEGIRVHYVRTPSVLFREDTNLVSGVVIKASYDVDKNEYRSLQTWPQRSEGAGWVTAQLRGALNRQDSVETALFPLYAAEPNGLSNTVLKTLVSKGSVASAMEDVDGSACWRVEIVDETGTGMKQVAFLDPRIGFCPRRIQFRSSKGELQSSNTFLDYSEVSSGIWFPGRIKTEFAAALGYPSQERVVKAVRCGVEASKQDLIIKFPSGTRVQLGDGDEEMIVP